jgi:hypothetical protein
MPRGATAEGLRSVAISGMSAPGTGDVYTNTPFGGAINNRGQILFGARIFDHNGYWLESWPGQVGKLAVDGNRAPGLAFKTFNSLAGGPISLNDNGDSLVSFGFSPFPVDPYTPHANGVGDGLWVTSGGSGGLNLLAADGLPVPGLSSPNIFLLQQNSRLNQAGQVAFLTFAGDGIGSDVWVDSLGQTSRHVTQALAHAPGTPSGANFQNFGSLLVSDAGRVAFDARLTAESGGVTSSNNSGLWQETPAGDLRLVARAGDAAPGISNTTFASGGFLIDPAAINGPGQLAFRASVSGIYNGLVEYAQDSGGNLRIVAQQFGIAPGTHFGMFTNLFEPRLNDLGQVAFAAADNMFIQRGGDVTGIWSEGGGNGLQLVVRVGDQAPDIPPTSQFSAFSDPILNNAGHVMFLGSLLGSAVTPGVDDYGLWAQDPKGQLKLVLRRGDQRCRSTPYI